MPSGDDRAGFMTALFSAMRSRGVTQERLGKMLPEPITQGAVGHWLTGKNVPRPDVVFAVEKALGLHPGELSRHLGYYPVDMEKCPPPDVVTAIDRDPELPTAFKVALLAAYREFADAARRSR